jgi:hypothetical protein
MDDRLVKRRTKFLAGGAVAAAAVGSGVTFAVAQGGDDSEPPITGDDLARASEAALAYTGGGRVTETEAEGSHFEVEVKLDDGTQVEVQLDENFRVVGAEADDDGAGDDDGVGDDD